ncbi:DUF6913 domain-containing protein [Parabacteroides sp. FAFU027]|uniref:DUF6913 domain-containing protein n=1 Tax=Parabacteroides sp. FAFU027 TaxID=2922715 RepID=UPI001FAF6E9A|nr:hypothetical protein [Parabacteroides sp. FAFU027]
MIKSIITNKIRNNIQKQVKTAAIIDFSDIRKIVLIFEIADYPFIQNVVSQLENEGKECRLVVYSEAKEKNFPEIRGFIFSNRDLDFWNVPKSEIETRFLDEISDADMLLDLTVHNYLPLSYLISKASVKLKAGIKKEGFDLYDFMLEAPKNVDFRFLSEQIMSYLRKLKS